MIQNLPYHYSLLSLLILVLFTSQCLSRVIYNNYEIRDLFNMNSDFAPSTTVWIQSAYNYGRTFSCYSNSIPAFGGYYVFTPYSDYAYTDYSTPQAHTVVYYSITIFFVNTWYGTSDVLRLAFGNGLVTSQTVNWHFGGTYNLYSCTYEMIMRGKVSHTGSLLRIVAMKAATYSSGTFGIRKIFLRLANEPAPTTADQLCVMSDTLTSAGIVMNNKCTCPKNQYFDGTSCQKCDISCEGCSGPLPSDCFACNFGRYYDGTQCQNCTSTCTDCGTCGICSENNFYMDHVCLAKCDLPFLKYISGDRRFCLSPCLDNEVIYSDGTCHTTCIAPFIYPPAVDYTKPVCKSPCTSAQTLFYNGTCSSKSCQYPLYDKIYGGAMKVCQYPCDPATEIYYKSNASCMPTCGFPFIIKTYGLFQACEPPCSPGYYYAYWNNSCIATCPSLLQKGAVSGIFVCNPPQCGNVLCSPCGVGNTCPEAYYCNSTQGAFCFPYYKYKLQIDIIKPILNGALLSVDVSPTNGIRTIDEILLVSIAGLQENVDYVSKITQTGKGQYEVQITISSSVNDTSLIVSFVYGPYSLGIKGSYSLPRLTFISADIQASAQTTQKGSQIAFLIFIVTIAGCVIGGDLSSLWTSMPESQYSYYLLYLNVNYLHHTEAYFESLSNYDVLVSSNSGNSAETLPLTFRNFLPTRYFTRDYNPDFMQNSDQIFLQSILAVTVLGVSMLLLRYARFSGRGIWIMKILMYVCKSMKWNLLIRQAMTYSMPLAIAAFIQLQSLIFGDNIDALSLLASVTTILAFLIGFAQTFMLIRRIGAKESKRLAKRFGTLWEDLDTSINSKYYYWLVALRGCLLAYLTVFASMLPYVQIIVLIIYQAFIVSLFLSKFRLRRVFCDRFLNKITFIEELCLLGLKISILVFLFLESFVSDNMLILMGWIMIIPAAVAQAVQIFYSTSSQLGNENKFLQMFELLKRYLRGKRKKIKRVSRTRSNLSRPRRNLSRLRSNLPGAVTNKIFPMNMSTTEATLQSEQ